MNAVSYAIQKINLEIPKQILALAFQEEKTDWRGALLSIDEAITRKVLRPIVFVDMDLVGGTEIVVSLEGLTPVYADTYSIVYNVPMDRTGHREIISALSIGYLPFSGTYAPIGYGITGLTPMGSSDLELSARKMGDSLSSVPPLTNADVEIAPGNTIIIRDQLRVPGAYQLRVVVGNESNLNNIPKRAYLDFSKLCILAVKYWIYTNMRIEMEQGFLLGGQEVPGVKSYIDSLSDVQEMYNTFLNETWRAVAVMFDKTQHMRYMRSQMNPGG